MSNQLKDGSFHNPAGHPTISLTRSEHAALTDFGITLAKGSNTIVMSVKEYESLKQASEV